MPPSRTDGTSRPRHRRGSSGRDQTTGREERPRCRVVHSRRADQPGPGRRKDGCSCQHSSGSPLDADFSSDMPRQPTHRSFPSGGLPIRFYAHWGGRRGTKADRRETAAERKAGRQTAASPPMPGACGAVVGSLAAPLQAFGTARATMGLELAPNRRSRADRPGREGRE